MAIARVVRLRIIAASLICISLPGSWTFAQTPSQADSWEEAQSTDHDSRIFQEPTGPLTMEAAIRLALEVNPTIATARREIEATEAQVLQGSLRPNPGFSYTVENTGRISRSSAAQVE
jgi:hypothetical protein